MSQEVRLSPNQTTNPEGFASPKPDPVHERDSLFSSQGNSLQQGHTTQTSIYDVMWSPNQISSIGQRRLSGPIWEKAICLTLAPINEQL